MSGSEELIVRPAKAEEREAVIGLFDRALLAVDRERIREDTGTDELLVAVHNDRLVGAAFLEQERLHAIAVRPALRAQGIGRALVEFAAADRPAVIAEFEEGVKPFYERLSFEIDRVDDRFRGRLE